MKNQEDAEARCLTPSAATGKGNGGVTRDELTCGEPTRVVVAQCRRWLPTTFQIGNATFRLTPSSTSRDSRSVLEHLNSPAPRKNVSSNMCNCKPETYT